MEEEKYNFITDYEQKIAACKKQMWLHAGAAIVVGVGSFWMYSPPIAVLPVMICFALFILNCIMGTKAANDVTNLSSILTEHGESWLRIQQIREQTERMFEQYEEEYKQAQKEQEENKNDN